MARLGPVPVVAAFKEPQRPGTCPLPWGDRPLTSACQRLIVPAMNTPIAAGKAMETRQCLTPGCQNTYRCEPKALRRYCDACIVAKIRVGRPRGSTITK